MTNCPMKQKDWQYGQMSAMDYINRKKGKSKMIDYDMLFEEGNLVALKNMYEGKTYYYFVEPYEEGKIDWNDYRNESLSCFAEHCKYENNKYHGTTFQIMFIAKLDFDNKTADMLYSRIDGINKAIKEDKMPKLENGMFVRVVDDSDPFDDFDDYGVVVDNKIVYRNGGWCEAREEIPYIVAVWGGDVNCFEECGSSAHKPIWKRIK